MRTLGIKLGTLGLGVDAYWAGLTVCAPCTEMDSAPSCGLEGVLDPRNVKFTCPGSSWAQANRVPVRKPEGLDVPWAARD